LRPSPPQRGHARTWALLAALTVFVLDLLGARAFVPDTFLALVSGGLVAHDWCRTPTP